MPFYWSPTRRTFILTSASGAFVAGITGPARAATMREISGACQSTLSRLYAASDRADSLGTRAHAVLIFPRIGKGSSMPGVQNGEGALFINGEPAASAYYRIVSPSFGLPAAPTFALAFFLMTQGALDYLRDNETWPIGTGPAVVVIDRTLAQTADPATMADEVYALPYGASGLVAGVALEGASITRIQPEP